MGQHHGTNGSPYQRLDDEVTIVLIKDLIGQLRNFEDDIAWHRRLEDTHHKADVIVGNQADGQHDDIESTATLSQRCGLA